jgi:hypothetical protein
LARTRRTIAPLDTRIGIECGVASVVPPSSGAVSVPGSPRPDYATFALNGTVVWRCPGTKNAASMQFSMSAANGKVSGSYSGVPLSGKIDSAGNVTAEGSSPPDFLNLRGSVTQAGGVWQGSGTFTHKRSTAICEAPWTAR